MSTIARRLKALEDLQLPSSWIDQTPADAWIHMLTEPELETLDSAMQTLGVDSLSDDSDLAPLSQSEREAIQELLDRWQTFNEGQS